MARCDKEQTHFPTIACSKIWVEGYGVWGKDCMHTWTYTHTRTPQSLTESDGLQECKSQSSAGLHDSKVCVAPYLAVELICLCSIRGIPCITKQSLSVNTWEGLFSATHTLIGHCSSSPEEEYVHSYNSPNANQPHMLFSLYQYWWICQNPIVRDCPHTKLFTVSALAQMWCHMLSIMYKECFTSCSTTACPLTQTSVNLLKKWLQYLMNMHQIWGRWRGSSSP